MVQETGQRAAVTQSEDFPETQTYYAVSLFKTKSFWLNIAAIVLEILNATDVAPLYSTLKITPEQRGLLVMILNIIVRRFTERPARVMKPGDTLPVEVKRL